MADEQLHRNMLVARFMKHQVCPLVNKTSHLNISIFREEDQVQRSGLEVVLTLATQHGTLKTTPIGKLSSNPTLCWSMRSGESALPIGVVKPPTSCCDRFLYWVGTNTMAATILQIFHKPLRLAIFGTTTSQHCTIMYNKVQQK